MPQPMRVDFAIAYAFVIAALAGAAAPACAAADDRIRFGPPGPPQTIRFADAIASASVTFRMSHDAQYDTGPAAVSPSISSGSVSVSAFGVRRRYDLAAILPTATDRVELSERSLCGAATALSRRGEFLVIEAVLAEKGCAAFATFVDLRDGRVFEEAFLDAAWDHRYDTRRYRASGESVRLARVERIVLDAIRPNVKGTSFGSVAWPFLIVRATDARGRTRAFAVDLDLQPTFNGRALTLKAGDAAFLGPADIDDRFTVVRLFDGQLFFRPGAIAEARLDALQTPTPPDTVAIVRRNHWFDEADVRAEHGDFDGAIRAFATMMSFHGVGADIDAGDARMLATCRRLQTRVRAGTVSASAASRAFSHGCAIERTS